MSRYFSVAEARRWLEGQGAELLADLRWLAGGFVALGRDVWRVRAPVLHAGAILGGWALLTVGVAPILEWWGLKAYALSGGVLLLSLAGWGHLRVLFGVGVYALHQRGKKAQ